MVTSAFMAYLEASALRDGDCGRVLVTQRLLCCQQQRGTRLPIKPSVPLRHRHTSRTNKLVVLQSSLDIKLAFFPTLQLRPLRHYDCYGFLSFFASSTVGGSLLAIAVPNMRCN